MLRSRTILGLVLVALIGCAKGSASNPEKQTGLEAKVKRLEEDFRAAASARDAFRHQFEAAEEKLVASQRNFDETVAAVIQERDRLKAELKTRTAERDQAINQYATFIKGLKEQLDKAETNLTGSSPSLVGVGSGEKPLRLN